MRIGSLFAGLGGLDLACEWAFNGRTVWQLDQVGDTVLDPFSGSGTTSIAAARLGRSCIGLEQSAEYAALSRERIPAEVGHTAETAMREKAAGVDLLAGLPLFGGAA